MKFIDEVTIDIRSGNGGPGAVHFRREKYRPKMGPDGGDGGRGGHVIFVASHGVQSLLDFRFQPKYWAKDGEKGQGNDCNGQNAEDLVIKVPVGTMVYDAESGELLCDLVEEGVAVQLLKGGQGGLGNMNFATSTRQAPDFAQPGKAGQQRRVRLELKLLADVALVGFPNAGKSTLISRVSAAKPKIADYPFTTLVPNLGVVRTPGQDFVLADVPGLIEGAAEGKGLGHQFLRHCERSRLLVMLLDLDPFNGRSLDEEFRILRTELENYSEELASKPFLLVLSKGDVVSEDDLTAHLADKGRKDLKKLLEIKKPINKIPILISAVSGQGLDSLKTAISKELIKLGPREFKYKVAKDLEFGDLSLFNLGRNK